MISLIEITLPPLGSGYQIIEGENAYITDLNGNVLEPKEYFVVQSPVINIPDWYTPTTVTATPQPSVSYIPQTVTMRQARLALLDVGLLDTIEQALNSLPEPQRTRSLIEWNHGSVVERDSALVTQMSSALGLTSEQVDNLFLQANTY